MAFEAPRRLVRALDEARRAGGDGAAAWLAGLPALVGTAAADHGVVVERMLVPGGRSSVVLLVRPADRDAPGTPAVLKLAPGRSRPAAERAALECWGGVGAARLLDARGGAAEGAVAGSGAGGPAAGGTLLLERLRPDVSLRSLPEARATLEAAELLRRLWVEPPGHPFESVAERTGRQADAMRAAVARDPEAAPLVDAALAVRAELLAREPERVLLHGTFRQSKALAADRLSWLAVGPDPVVGERAFDLARLVRDRVEDLVATDTGGVTARRRVRRLAGALEIDQERLRGWTLFRAVESGVRARRVGRAGDGGLLLEFASWL